MISQKAYPSKSSDTLQCLSFENSFTPWWLLRLHKEQGWDFSQTSFMLEILVRAKNVPILFKNGHLRVRQECLYSLPHSVCFKMEVC